MEFLTIWQKRTLRRRVGNTLARMRHFAIIGGGPAGLMAAHALVAHGKVDLHEQERTVGRKFLVAGEGGLNITHEVSIEGVAAHYAPAGFLDAALKAFGPEELRHWLAELGIPTYTGTSGRVFPRVGIKPAEVLKAIRDDLRARGVRINLRHRLVGFDGQARPIVEHEGVRHVLSARATLFALGGASWPRTGSRGDWREAFERIGVRTVAFAPSNCGVEVVWPRELLTAHAGKPLKNIRVSAGDPAGEHGFRSLRGEATLTRYGLEGNAIYPVVPVLRATLAHQRAAALVLDLKPDVPEDTLRQRLTAATTTERAAALKLDRASLAILKAFTTKDVMDVPAALAHAVKHLPVAVTGLRPIAEAISTVGGIALEEVAKDFSLRKHPHLFVAGEMLDWDAPTGGFLLQAAFSMGRWAAMGMLAR